MMNFKEIDFWYSDLGLNVLPIHFKSKQSLILWKEWQDKVIPKEVYEEWKNKEFVNNNCAIITGKIHSGQYFLKYLVCIDIDNKIGMEEFLSHFGEIKSLEELAQKTIVVQHEDAKAERAHIYFITVKPLSKKTGISRDHKDSKAVPAIEVKSDSSTYLLCPPSTHPNGYQYHIIGTKQIQVLDEAKSQKLEDTLNKIYQKHSSSTNHKQSTGNFSYLTTELKNITKALKLDDLNYKISNGTRNNTLLAVADSLLYHHYNSKDIEYLKRYLFEVNQKLCEIPLEDKELEIIWTQATSFIRKSIAEKLSFKNNQISNSKRGYTQSNEDPKNSKEYTVFKYTSNNHIYESIIIAGKPFFITFDNEEGLKIVDKIEQETRILKPPHLEEYPSKSYNFENKEELEKFIKMVNEKHISVDSLFWKINEFVSKFIVHYSSILEHISALILFSYFQDKFSTIPYTMFVSDGGSGKSTIGNVFEDLGYRCVNMTDPTTANIFRIFGIIEAGQCTLVLDEAEKIDKDKEMMSILKTGYENGKRVQRVNQQGKQEHFHTFGLKILIAERTPNPSYAKGVLDRTFIISNYKGKPQLDIKEVRTPKTKEQKTISAEIDFLRKALFVYRLVHFNDDIADIETGLEGRDKELCKPILQLFYDSKYQRRIERIFEILLDEKNDRKANSLEREILEVIVSLFESHQDGIIPFNEIWFHLLDKTNGTINEYKKHEMETEIHGNIFKGTLAKTLRDRFGAKDPKIRDSKTRCLVFDIQRIKNHFENYAKDKSPTRIFCSLKVNDSSDSSDSYREDRFNNFFTFEPSSLINGEEYDENYPRGNTTKDEDIRNNNDENNTMGLGNAVITVTPVTNENIENNMMNVKEEIFRCYYNCNVQFTTKQEYVKHCVITHSNKTAFPSLVEIDKYGLKPQGKHWETPPLS